MPRSLRLPELRWRVRAPRVGHGLGLQGPGAPSVRQEASGHGNTFHVLTTSGPFEVGR